MLDKSKLSKLSSKSDQNTNVSRSEIARFDLLAESWWDPNGKYKTALIFNQARIDYFVPQICKHFNRDIDDENCLAGLSVLDVGSGGGLVCEPLAKLGANVTGIDASEMSVEVARRHAQKTGLNIHYQHILSTDKLKEGRQFDIVINAEVVEHVPEGDVGNHSVCAIVSEAFLNYSLSRGNDLITPNPLYQFQGLKPGDRWCLCAMRWREALYMEVAPKVDLEATNESALNIIPLDVLEKYSHKESG
jgi:uncharacterized protein (DUF2237 family)